MKKMKNIFLLLVFALFAQGYASAQSPVEGSEVIGRWDLTFAIEDNAMKELGLFRHGLMDSDVYKRQIFLIHMNTYGGTVLDADSIRTKILQSSIPVYVFIDNNAASAGALISIACDSIYMRPGGSIGAATVVSQTGDAMPDKYQSYMRSTMLPPGRI